MKKIIKKIKNNLFITKLLLIHSVKDSVIKR